MISELVRPGESVEWLSAKEAAALTGREERTILEWGTKGYVKTRDEINPETNKPRKLLHAGDIERVIYERANGIKNHSGASKPRTPRAIAAPAITVQMPAPEALPLFLTLDQAARYSGLPRRVLEELAKALSARDVGKGSRGGQWRFSRAVLDKFAAS